MCENICFTIKQNLVITHDFIQHVQVQKVHDLDFLDQYSLRLIQYLIRALGRLIKHIFIEVLTLQNK